MKYTIFKQMFQLKVVDVPFYASISFRATMQPFKAVINGIFEGICFFVELQPSIICRKRILSTIVYHCPASLT